jgi:hypothetical protein
LVAAGCLSCRSQSDRTARGAVHADTGLSSAYAIQERAVVAGTTNESLRQVSQLPRVPACSQSDIRCFIDTASATVECCTGDLFANWILVLDRADSLELFVGPSTGTRRPDASITMSQVGRRRTFQEHDVNTASYLRYRFPDAGAYALSIGVDPGSHDSVVYDLRIRQFDAPVARRLTSTVAMIDVRADSTAQIAILPRRALAASSHVPSFVVRTGKYKVLAPGLDSVFLCRLPCTFLRALPLVAGRTLVDF